MKKLFTLLTLLVAIVTGAKAQTVIYQTEFKETPASPATATSSTGDFLTTAVSWASDYPNYFLTSGSSGQYTLSFATPLDLSGYSDVKVKVFWGSTSNRPLNISINSGSNEKIDEISASSERSKVRAAEGTIAASTTSLSSIKFASSGGGAVYLFKVEITGTSAGPRDPSFTVPSEIVVGETGTITGPSGLNFTATVKSGSEYVSVDGATITANAIGNAVITVSSEAVADTWNKFSKDYNVSVVDEPVAPTGPLFQWKPKTGISDTDIKAGTYTFTSAAPGDWLTSVSGGSVDMVVPSNGNMRIRGSQLAYNSNNPYFKITLDNALAAGDQIDVTSSGNKNNLYISLTTTRPSSDSAAKAIIVQGTTFTIPASSDLVGENIIYVWRKSSTTQVGEFTITRPAPSSDPVITADATASINATESGVAATKEIAVEGAHLTGTTLSATLNPAVEGLSVALASDAISDGAITTTATLSYTATANANGTTTLTISDGTTSKEVTVTYISNVVKFTQEDVSEATTWDIMNKVSGSDVNGTYDDIYANIAGLTFADGFNAKSLHVKTTGAYVYRSGNKASQGAELSFNTTVPGLVTVYFSNNGNGSNKAIVNGVEGTKESTDGGSNGSKAVSESFNVEAGEVTITGTAASGIRFYKVVFTPRPASIDLTINAAAGATTVYSDYALDFSTLTNVKAYIETGTGDKLSWTQVTSAPAKTGLLVVSSETALTVPTAASSETDVTGNRLKGVATGETKTVTADDNIYIFTLHDGKPGFIKSDTGRSLLVGKAYLDLGEEATGAREFFELFEDGTTTGISSIDNDQLTTDNDAPAYNLAGQKVGKGYKGIVIINGKKVVK